MPFGLPGVSLTLDIVSEGSTLSEWMVLLAVGQIWIVLLEISEDRDGSGEDIWVVGLKNCFGLSSD